MDMLCFFTITRIQEEKRERRILRDSTRPIQQRANERLDSYTSTKHDQHYTTIAPLSLPTRNPLQTLTNFLTNTSKNITYHVTRTHHLIEK